MASCGRVPDIVSLAALPRAEASRCPMESARFHVEHPSSLRSVSGKTVGGQPHGPAQVEGPESGMTHGRIAIVAIRQAVQLPESSSHEGPNNFPGGLAHY
jgi:hypothetical protein